MRYENAAVMVDPAAPLLPGPGTWTEEEEDEFLANNRVFRGACADCGVHYGGPTIGPIRQEAWDWVIVPPAELVIQICDICWWFRWRHRNNWGRNLNEGTDSNPDDVWSSPPSASGTESD